MVALTAVIHQVAIVVPAYEVEMASDRLWQLGVLGIEEFGGSVLATGEPSSSVCLVATPTDGDIAPLLHAFAGYTTSVIEIDAATYAGFLDGWREFAAPVWAGDRVVFWPSWWPVPDRDPTGVEVMVVLDSGQSFGSGSHPTTAMAAAALATLVRPGHVVADVGCGSGVLAVTAALLGAAEVRAVDIDAYACAITLENARRNNVAEQIIQAEGSAVDLVNAGVEADVVVANITAGVLIDAASDLVRLARPDARLLLTGILATRQVAVEEAFASLGWTVADSVMADGWVLLVLVRTP